MFPHLHVDTPASQCDCVWRYDFQAMTVEILKVSYQGAQEDSGETRGVRPADIHIISQLQILES